MNYLISVHTTPARAAIAACEQLATRFARDVSKSGDGLSIQSSDRHRHFAERAKALRKQESIGVSGVPLASPFAGGISKADKETRESDTDRVEPAFKVDMHENVGGSASSWESGG